MKEEKARELLLDAASTVWRSVAKMHDFGMIAFWHVNVCGDVQMRRDKFLDLFPDYDVTEYPADGGVVYYLTYDYDGVTFFALSDENPKEVQNEDVSASEG